MLNLVAIKSQGKVVKGKTYQLGGIIQNKNQVVLMQHGDIVPGYYDCDDVFGISKKEITQKITKER